VTGTTVDLELLETIYFGTIVNVCFFCPRTLSTFLKENSRIELDTANDIFRQMMMGLQHAHQHHIVHHDLKPDNILVDDNQRIMISDFGTGEIIRWCYLFYNLIHSFLIQL
jgi:serine/threonine protein kinase